MNTIVLHPKTVLAEIFQSIEVDFCFVNKIDNTTYKQIHVPCKCRDFLGDCIWSKNTNRPVRIWSFVYDYRKSPFDEDKLRLSLTFPNVTTLNNFVRRWDEIAQIELKANLIPSSLIYTKEKNVLIVEADNVWQSVPWKLSLFTFYLKRLVYKNNKSLQQPENGYNEVLTEEKEEILLSSIYNISSDYDDNLTTAHNNSGFVSLISGTNPLYVEIFKEDNK